MQGFCYRAVRERHGRLGGSSMIGVIGVDMPLMILF